MFDPFVHSVVYIWSCYVALHYHKLTLLCYLGSIEVGQSNGLGQSLVNKSLHGPPSFYIVGFHVS